MAVLWHNFIQKCDVLSYSYYLAPEPGASPTGGGGGVAGVGTLTFENRGGRPPRNLDISLYCFLKTYKMFAFSNIFKTKWPKSEENAKFLGQVGLGDYHSDLPSQKFVATPLAGTLQPYQYWHRQYRPVPRRVSSDMGGGTGGGRGGGPPQTFQRYAYGRCMERIDLKWSSSKWSSSPPPIVAPWRPLAAFGSVSRNWSTSGEFPTHSRTHGIARRRRRSGLRAGVPGGPGGRAGRTLYLPPPARTERGRTAASEDGEDEEDRRGEDRSGPERTGEDWRGPERTGEDWRGPERTGEDRRGPERTGEDWRGPERTGEDWRGLERTGEDWRGLERTGEDWRGLERTGEDRREPERTGEDWRGAEGSDGVESAGYASEDN